MSYAQAIDAQRTRTLNDMKAYQSTLDGAVDFFFKVGALREQDPVPAFLKAYLENREYALRTALWGRDIRQGAGERKVFRDIVLYLENDTPEDAKILLSYVPILGRWDDLLLDFQNKDVEKFAYSLYVKGLRSENGLAAKWAPRKGIKAAKLRKYMQLPPRQYRKYIVKLTNVVEQKMCAKEWDKINYEHVPSLASARYRSAFYRHDEQRYTEYVEKLKSGKATAKTNAVYPYDVVKSLSLSNVLMTTLSKAEKDFIIAQWDALPNYIQDAKVLPVIDTSGSMGFQLNNNTLKAAHVAFSLGIYFADKNTGPFNGCFVTFSHRPTLEHLEGNILQKFYQVNMAHWDMNTDLHKTFDLILQVAKDGNVNPEDMPDTILILSDMQFDSCIEFDDSAMEMIRRKYIDAGYEVPKIVFWNIVAYNNVPVRFNEQGVALVSGASPSIIKTILSDNIKTLTPINIMTETIMSDRYTPVLQDF